MWLWAWTVHFYSDLQGQGDRHHPSSFLLEKPSHRHQDLDCRLLVLPPTAVAVVVSSWYFFVSLLPLHLFYSEKALASLDWPRQPLSGHKQVAC